MEGHYAAQQHAQMASRISQLEAQLDLARGELGDANLEIRRLKDLIQAYERPPEEKIVRFEHTETRKGWAFIVTDPRGDEERMAKMACDYLNLLWNTAEALAAQKDQQTDAS